ncbi:unnamed protein product, partial [Ilex paraguariensis]
LVKDIFLWRKKDLSIIVLLVATTIWVLLEVYQFNFITVVSWVAMAIVTALFIWGNIQRLLGKYPPNLSGLEITEQSAMELANSIGELIEEGIRLVFRVGAESEWYVFAGTTAALWVLSQLGSYCDLLTILYLGIVVGMTVPAIYVKYEYKIRKYEGQFRTKFQMFYKMIDEKVLMKMKNMVGSFAGEKKQKDKKME